MNHFIIAKSYRKISGEIIISLTDDIQLILQGKDFDHYEENGTKMIIIGDLIDSKETLFATKIEQIPRLKGNFYAIVVKKEEVRIFSSFLSVLPMYYTSDFDLISSSIDYIRENSPNVFTTDKKFVLESLLFNYGFFNRTLYKEVSLVPSNHYVRINRLATEIKKHFETTSLFTNTVRKGKKSAYTLSNVFIAMTEAYFPDQKFDVAFTSGFDGRTLVSCARYHQKMFATFSFGRSENADVYIPKSNATALGIPYRYFDLGDPNYIHTFFIKSAEEYIKTCPGGNGLIYAHFLHSTIEIAKDSEYLISGVMGSELFRALHLTGAVTSQALVDVFTNDTEKELSASIRNSKALKSIRLEDFEQELEELILELIAYKSNMPNEYTQNQQFYIFVFEEVFRKFFGQWIYIQMHHINVRTPFLDYGFIKELLQTRYAGANNDFFTDNPLKRMKGQFLYADIIKKTNKTIYHQKTGKGYRPKDIRESLFLPNIILPFIKKRFQRKVHKVNLDNLGIISGVLSQKEMFKKLIKHTEWVNSEYLCDVLENLSPYTNEKDRDTLLMTLSLSKALRQN